MASGHASRVDRPNTWLLRPGCAMLKVLANTEPSTHGTADVPQHQRPTSVIGVKADLADEDGNAGAERIFGYCAADMVELRSASLRWCL